jgi:hypothetical protein
MFSNVMNVGWLVLWSRFYPAFALPFLLLSAASLYAMLYFSCRQLQNCAGILLQESKPKDIWLIRILVHNGIGLYAAWATIAILLNTNVVLIYVGELSQKVGGTITLSLILTSIISWFFLELLVLDAHLRYLLSPYIAILLTLGDSIANNWNPESSNSILMAFTLTISILFAVAKIIVMLVRHKIDPIYRKEEAILSFRPHDCYNSMSKSYDRIIMT